MTVRLPPKLQTMIDDGRWATPGAACDERIPRSVARRWDPHALGIHLEQQPALLSDEVARVPELEKLWNLNDVDPTRCVVIADFGLGTDNPIILDLSTEPPSVRVQHWIAQQPNAVPTWTEIAGSFDEFVALLGLG